MSQKSLDELVSEAATNLQYSLRNLPYEQLNDLINNKAKLDQHCQSSPVLNVLITKRDGLKRVAKSYAEHNLDHEQRFYSTKNTLRETQIQTKRLKAECERLKAELEQIGENRRIDKVANLLRASVRKTEDESEALMEQFLDGKSNLDQFVEEYQKKRQLFHEKEFKSRKLDEILQMQRI
ncbi:unnamed protein product [Bursaphelenchus xylophilus]|uniref:(pine wood nematode) hypothetical protein n=1 Tax=Bursaphelenchus xylophilus TaxID=6326 RepID=A0A1I7RUV1_BURXY|nr:unnamed protein product [Bursaphelenchus xylophilus]CAG9105408.1 unnamed protein product [Bursaphelenchus xylophilus]